jgi:hypothetical protein
MWLMPRLKPSRRDGTGPKAIILASCFFVSEPVAALDAVSGLRSVVGKVFHVYLSGVFEKSGLSKAFNSSAYT